MKKCIFCDRDCSGKKRAKEHIFPQHLLRELSLLNEKLEHSPFRIVKGDFSGGHISIVPKSRSLTYSKFLAGQICARCNNGWMSKLEEEVQPILYPLIRGELHVSSLQAESHQTLASWFFKTSIVLSQSIGALQHSIPRHHARLFYQSQGSFIPSGVVVLSYSCLSSDYLWSLCPTWIVKESSSLKKDLFEKHYASSYKIFVQLGNLMLVACHWPWKSAVYTYEDWGIVPIGGREICVTVSTDCREVFCEESDQMMMAIGVNL